MNPDGGTAVPISRSGVVRAGALALNRLRMASRLVIGADGLESRLRLAGYLSRRAVRTRPPGSKHTLAFSLGGVDWEIAEEASQLGGIHDVWLAREYDAVAGFRASPGSTIVDIGANIGAYSLWQAHYMRGCGTVVAVEAASATASVLRQNLRRNPIGECVTVVERAVWSESGAVEFLASNRSTSTSGIAATAAADLVVDPSHHLVEAVTYSELLGTLGLLDSTLDVVKIDVEGAEAAIVASTDPEVLRLAKRYVIEVDENTASIVDTHLGGAGFMQTGRARNVAYYVRAS